MRIRNMVKISILAVVVIIVSILFAGGLEKNNSQNWQHVQSVGGNITIRDKAGWYPKWFATVTTYPRYVDAAYNDQVDEGNKDKESIRVTFNDGGTAQVGTFVRFSTPTAEDARKEFHRQFSGNIKNASYSVKAHLINCIKAAGPVMSASENQAARKAEFAQLIEKQLVNGLFKMRQVDRELKGQFDEDNNAITVQATEIIVDSDGVYLVENSSPLETYSIKVLQFSVTTTDYDPETRKQFAAKKSSFLAAAKYKAEKAEMVAERLKIEEEGKKDRAKAEATANVLMATAVIAAEQKANVALQTKIEAETKASQLLSVAEIEKAERVMIATAALEVATIAAQEADQLKIAMILQAEGRKEAINLSGAITELEEAQIRAEVDKARFVAEAYAKIKMPTTMIIAGSGGDGGNTMTEHLVNIRLMEAAGLFDKTIVDRTAVTRTVRKK